VKSETQTSEIQTSETQTSAKIAVVTGGAQGIGRGIADRLSDSGSTVVIGDLRDPADGSYPWIELDVADETSVAAFTDLVAAKYGRIDIVVNNAGIMFETSVTDQQIDTWNQMMAINLTGPFLMIKHAARHMPSGSAIINVGSIEGDRCNPNHAAYAASKSGVHGLTRAAAVDLGPAGIRCNAVAPGWIDTNLNAAYVDNHPDRDEVIAELAKLHPVGHVGSPRDVGDVVVWLASDTARFVTGQIITVDGGRTARPPLPSILNS